MDYDLPLTLLEALEKHIPDSLLLENVASGPNG
jgi:hypothetical protein